ESFTDVERNSSSISISMGQQKVLRQRLHTRSTSAIIGIYPDIGYNSPSEVASNTPEFNLSGA
ncbi:MAG: hypothetical protein U9Q31_02345, partial [Chloroflexota bacterium]|nr:hypothetical protein [Chloroflexota bacterium]